MDQSLKLLFQTTFILEGESERERKKNKQKKERRKENLPTFVYLREVIS